MQTVASNGSPAAQQDGGQGQAARADTATFESIMRQNNQRLFRLTRSILKNDAEAEEVVQETYVKAFTHQAEMAKVENLPAWLARIAVNEAISQMRRRKPEASLELLPDNVITEGPSGAADRGTGDPEAAAARSEIRLALEAAIDDLPQAFRTVFVLRAVEEFSVEETAACLGIPSDTVKTRLHRAKRNLKQALSQQVQAALSGVFPFAGRRCDRIVATVLARPELKAEGAGPPGR